MGRGEGEREHEGDDLSVDDSSWSDGEWSEDDDEVGEFLTPLSLMFFFGCGVLFSSKFLGVPRGLQESLSFEDSGSDSGSGSDAESDEVVAEESDSSEDEVRHSLSLCWS